MPNHRSRSNNRLLALEQELLAKRRLAQEGQNRQNFHQQNQEQTQISSQVSSRSRQTNNRLLQLEQELLQAQSQAELSKSESPKLKSPKAKSKSSLVKSQVFDTGEPIILEYNSPDNSPDFPVIAPKASVIPISQALEGVELPKIELSDELTERLEPESPIVPEITENIERPTEIEAEAEIETVLSQTTELEDGELPRIAVSDKLSDKLTELLEAESPIVPEIIENIERSIEPEAEIGIETVPSQGAELIAETEKQPNPIAADLPSVFAAIPTEPPESLTTPIAASAEPKSDRQPPRDSKPNPHSIFDCLGKNMAYATTFDVGTVELEQLFDEFDRTLEQAERKQTSDSVEQQRQNLELEKRFDEFDRVLDRQEQAKTTKTPILKTQSPPEILADKKAPEEAAPELAILENQEIEESPPPPESKAIPDQAIALEITPLESPQVAVVQPMNYEPKLDLNVKPQLNLKLEVLLWQTGINFISLIIWLFNFICRQEVDSRSIIAALSDRREQKQSNDGS